MNNRTDPAESLRIQNKTFARLITRLIGFAFLLSLSLLIYSFYEPLSWSLNPLFHFDQLSLVTGTAVLLFTYIVLSYSSRYMSGSTRLPRFLSNCALFSLSVLLMVSADHIALFITGWLCMGLLMSELIGGYTHYQEGKVSRRFARRNFLLSTALLAAGLIILSLQTGHWMLTEILQVRPIPQGPAFHIAVLLLIGSAVIQSGLFPFQRWLMSSMTAPTPASALMHAGFVNAGAILLSRVAPLLYKSDFLWILVLVGGFGALVGKFSKFVQPHIKQKLACSTTAQMGFMLLQCGLGFFAAAVTHLILHGFYKAYLFLSTGEAARQTSPDWKIKDRWKLWHVPLSVASGLLGGLIFAYATGKGLELNSGFFLTLVIVLTVIHGTQDLLKHSELSSPTRLLAIPLLTIPALLAYALVYNGISSLMHHLPMVDTARPVTWDQLVIGGLYLAAFVVIELDLYQKSRRLYVHLLNLSQPKSDTILQ